MIVLLCNIPLFLLAFTFPIQSLYFYTAFKIKRSAYLLLYLIEVDVYFWLLFPFFSVNCFKTSHQEILCYFRISAYYVNFYHFFIGAITNVLPITTQTILYTDHFSHSIIFFTKRTAKGRLYIKENSQQPACFDYAFQMTTPKRLLCFWTACI